MVKDMKIYSTHRNTHIAFIALAVTCAFAACKKTYKCTCDIHRIHPQTGVSGSRTDVIEIRGTQKKAKAECKQQEQKLDMGASSGVTCKVN